MSHATKDPQRQAARRPRCAQSTGWRKRALRRFHELVVKEALGTITSYEHKKLERYQQLRRQILGTYYSTPDQARREYADRYLMKEARALFRHASSNANGEPRSPKN